MSVAHSRNDQKDGLLKWVFLEQQLKRGNIVLPLFIFLYDGVKFQMIHPGGAGGTLREMSPLYHTHTHTQYEWLQEMSVKSQTQDFFTGNTLIQYTNTAMSLLQTA